MSEQIRNQHKNTMSNRPAGQSSMSQFCSDDEDNSGFAGASAHMDGQYIGDEITESEYNA